MPKKETPKEKTVLLEMVALGESSKATGGKMVRQGERREVPASLAEAAVKSGRWKALEKAAEEDKE